MFGQSIALFVFRYDIQLIYYRQSHAKRGINFAERTPKQNPFLTSLQIILNSN